MKKNLIITVILVVVMCLFIMGNTSGCEAEPTAQQVAAQANEKAIKDLIANDQLPKVDKSLDRENIKRRVDFINQPDRIGYLYLLSDAGQLIKEVQVLGKATSLNAYITPMDELVYGRVETSGGYISEAYVAEAPDLDGTWGTRPEGIFWFTPDGIYQEWNMGYFYSSERMTFTSKPLLIEEVKN